MYSREGKGQCIETIGYASSYYNFCSVDFLFHGSKIIFEEFALFLDFSHGGMGLNFPYKCGDHIDVEVFIRFVLVQYRYGLVFEVDVFGE